MATVPRQHITQRKIAEHVQRLGEHYPPIPLDSVDRTIKRPGLVARKFGHVIDYLARVELEVDRNVLELLFLLPDVDETNKDILCRRLATAGDSAWADLGPAPARSQSSRRQAAP